LLCCEMWWDFVEREKKFCNGHFPLVSKIVKAGIGAMAMPV